MSDPIYCLRCDITEPTKVEQDYDVIVWRCSKCGGILDHDFKDHDEEEEEQ